jgi:uncharacterized membrane protein
MAANRLTRASVWARLSKPQRALVIIVAAYVLFLFYLAKRCFDLFGYDSGGTAVFNNMMWWTIHGKPFFISALTTAEATKPVSNLAIHAALFWVFLVPIYWLLPGVYTLLFLQSLALGMAAVPMYLIARRVLQNEAAAVLAATAFILMPPIVSQNVNQIQEPSFLPVVLLFAFYYFIERKFAQFMLCAVLACLNRENVPLAVGMFGLWALGERRDWKWVVSPMAWGAAYFWFVTSVVMPQFREGQPWHVTDQFAYLGSSVGEIIWNAATKPGLVMRQLFAAPQIQYFVLLIQPMAWVLPFLHPAAVVALPDLAINLLSENSALRVIGWHYNLLTGSALFVGAIYGVRRVDERLQQRLDTRNVATLLAAGLLALSAAHWFLWFQPAYFKKRPYHATLVKAVQSIPPEASVLSPFRIQAHFSSRARYDAISVFQSQPEYAKTFEYVLLDANERQFPPFVTQEFFDGFDKNPEYEPVFAENGVYIFKRKIPASAAP